MPKTPDTIEEVQVEARDADVDAIVRKAASKAPYEGSTGGKVKVKITKFGHGHVSTGEHIPEHGDKIAEAGSILEVDKSVADALEAKGFAEIQ